MYSKKFQPLRNEDGIAMIAIIIAVTTAVLSYTAFTATSYVMMMSESKRQTRQLIGFEMMRQIGKTLEHARQRHHDQLPPNGAGDCSDYAVGAGGRGDSTLVNGRFCMEPNGFCIAHPLDPNGNVAGSEICFQAEDTVGAGATGRFTELRMVQKQPKTLVATLKMQFRQFHYDYGKQAFEVAKVVIDNASPEAYAVRARDYMPDVSVTTPPLHRFQIAAAEVCDPAVNSPTNICMMCHAAGGSAAALASNTARPACMRIAVCPKNLMGWGGCAANDEDWFWQTVAVLNPLISL